MSIPVVDLLEHTSCRVHLLRDLISAVQPDSLLLSESGLCGLSMALADIADAIESASQMVVRPNAKSSNNHQINPLTV